MIWGILTYIIIINELSGITDYASHVQSTGCMQLIDKPSRIYDDISDPLPICAEIKCKPSHKSIARPLVRRLAGANMELFLEDLDQLLRNFTYCNNTDLNVIISIMIEIIDCHFPKKRLIRNHYKTSKNPWITPEILASV